MNKPLLKEIASFFLCLGVLAGIAYYAGLFNYINIADFNFTPSSSQSEGSKQLLNTFNTKKSPNILRNDGNSRYSPDYIPPKVVDAVMKFRMFQQIFGSNKKVIFYVYSSNGSGGYFNEDFHNKMSAYASTNSNMYNLQAYGKDSFNSSKSIDSPSKIANSMDEFNNQRETADLYSRLSFFMETCGKKLCIISSPKRQYIQMNHPSPAQAQTVLNQYRSW